MRTKIFVISIPMLPIENLKMLEYNGPDADSVPYKTRFPGIAMLKDNIFGQVYIKIITVRTSDDNGRTEECYQLFKEELATLAAATGIELRITKEIIVPHKEDKAKENELLRNLFESYSKNAYVYMDITFGTKLTAVEMFSSLCYAEIAENCSIRSVVYGKYTFDNSEKGELFDASELYHTIRFMENAAHMNNKCFKDLMKQMVE